MISAEKIRKQEIDWNTACLFCEYLKQCEEHNGKYSDVEGCYILAGTHLCELSWKPFFEDCSKEKK
jgi:hypothetical protein